jgi:hypothetical protein
MKLVFHRENDEVERRSIARLDSLAIVRPLAPGTNCRRIGTPQADLSGTISNCATSAHFSGAIGTGLVYGNLFSADRAEFIQTELMSLLQENVARYRQPPPKHRARRGTSVIAIGNG